MDDTEPDETTAMTETPDYSPCLYRPPSRSERLQTTSRRLAIAAAGLTLILSVYNEVVR